MISSAKAARKSNHTTTSRSARWDAARGRCRQILGAIYAGQCFWYCILPRLSGYLDRSRIRVNQMREQDSCQALAVCAHAERLVRRAHLDLCGTERHPALFGYRLRQLTHIYILQM